MSLEKGGREKLTGKNTATDTPYWDPARLSSIAILQVFALHTSSYKGRSSVQQTGPHTLRNVTVICLLWLMLCCRY